MKIGCRLFLPLILLCITFMGCQPKPVSAPVLPSSPHQITKVVADWLVSLRYTNDTPNSNNVEIIASYLLENAPPSDPLVQLDVNGTLLTMVSDSTQNPRDYYIPAYPFTPGAMYLLRFLVNQEVVAETEIRAVFRETIDFPELLTPRTPIALHWSVGRDNQYQAVNLTAANGRKLRIHSKVLDAGIRSYTFPASALPDWGVGTIYALCVSQYNYIVLNRIGFLFWEDQLRQYEPDFVTKNNDKEKK